MRINSREFPSGVSKNARTDKSVLPARAPVVPSPRSNPHPSTTAPAPRPVVPLRRAAPAFLSRRVQRHPASLRALPPPQACPLPSPPETPARTLPLCSAARTPHIAHSSSAAPAASTRPETAPARPLPTVAPVLPAARGRLPLPPPPATAP